MNRTASMGALLAGVLWSAAGYGFTYRDGECAYLAGERHRAKLAAQRMSQELADALASAGGRNSIVVSTYSGQVTCYEERCTKKVMRGGDLTCIKEESVARDEYSLKAIQKIQAEHKNLEIRMENAAKREYRFPTDEAATGAETLFKEFLTQYKLSL